VYRGEFDSEAAVDVNIKGMAEEKMSYPLRYGYCLVGRVVRWGDAVSEPEQYKDRLVFCFNPHGSRAVADQSSVVLVPRGIPAEDAVFMPSMETALSLVHDAAPIVGERVMVVGVGLIGLLVTALLSRLPVTVMAVDLVPVRRALALAMGAKQALEPALAYASLRPDGAEMDASIEVSGSAKGLQTALDLTGFGGRVVVGSWYGSRSAPLKLGLDFHRSHLRLIVSQVSRIPGPLTDRWSKQRRFQAAWELVRELRPSTHLLTRRVSPSEVGIAYENLDKAVEDVAVLIDFTKERKNVVVGFGA
jgi:threonine dehydrogenase-like Zn-dependent dehydrogenase